MDPYRIVKLDESWKGRTMWFRYWTDAYLDVETTVEPGISRIAFCQKKLEAPVEKKLEVTWMENWLHAPLLFAAVDEEDNMAGYIELNLERWNNRMRVTNLFVEEPFRRKGVGAALMEHAVQVSRKAGARAMVLETQSCNMPAIRFYLSQGYVVGGVDLFCYSNHDQENREVRLEMMRLLEEDPGLGTGACKR